MEAGLRFDSTAPPRRLLSIRDWLLVALSFSTGAYEAVCFLSFGKVFTAFQTAGGAAAMPILRSFSGSEVDDSKITEAWPRRWSVALVLSLVAQAGFAACWMTRTSICIAGSATYVLIGLIAFAMGVQINAIRLLHVPGISTTAATAAILSLVSGIASRSIKPHAESASLPSWPAWRRVRW